MVAATLHRRDGGYMAILAVLVVGAAALAISLALLSTGVDSQRSNLVEQQSKQARALAVACAQEAMQQLHDNVAFSGTNAMKQGQGSCTYSVAVASTTSRTIRASGLVGSVVRNIQATATVGASTVTLSSWQEAATAPVVPAFVQGTSTVGGTVSSLPLAYASNEVAGDTNVVIIAFSNITSTISSVTDSAGNTYQLGASLVRNGSISQAIYYAANIAAGANTVTVTFNTTTATPDLRILEYSGVDQLAPLDTAASSTGTSTAPSSGSVTVARASSLIVGGGITTSDFTVPDANGNERVLSSALNLAEDRIVASTGSYSLGGATAASAAWIMQAIVLAGAGQ